MDVKAPLEHYERVTQVPASDRPVQASIALLRASGVNCLFRTTVDSRLLSEEGLDALANDLARLGVERHVFQACREVPLVPL